MMKSELLRKNKEVYKALNFNIKSYTEEETLDLLIKNPDLVQRPIVEISDKAILARRSEKINGLL